jgi:hypothetical protein
MGRLLLDLNNFPLEAISFGQNCFPTLPSIPCPPTELPTKRYDRRGCASTWCVLKFISLMAIAIFEEPPIQMIVQAFALVASIHDSPPHTYIL